MDLLLKSILSNTETTNEFEWKQSENGSFRSDRKEKRLRSVQQRALWPTDWSSHTKRERGWGGERVRGDIRHKGRAREQDRHKGIEALAHTSVEDYQTCGVGWWTCGTDLVEHRLEGHAALFLIHSFIHWFISWPFKPSEDCDVSADCLLSPSSRR